LAGLLEWAGANLGRISAAREVYDESKGA